MTFHKCVQLCRYDHYQDTEQIDLQTRPPCCWFVLRPPPALSGIYIHSTWFNLQIRLDGTESIISIWQMRKTRHNGVFILLSLVSFRKLRNWCDAKVRDSIFSDHQVRHPDFLGHTQEMTKSNSEKCVCQDLGSVLKGCKNRKPALSLGQVCLSWPFAEGLKAHVSTEPIKCTSFLRNVRTAGFQIL